MTWGAPQQGAAKQPAAPWHPRRGALAAGHPPKEKLVIEGLLAVKGARAGILEERAKVMMTAADTAAAARSRPAHSAKKPAKKR